MLEYAKMTWLPWLSLVFAVQGITNWIIIRLLQPTYKRPQIVLGWFDVKYIYYTLYSFVSYSMGRLKCPVVSVHVSPSHKILSLLFPDWCLPVHIFQIRVCLPLYGGCQERIPLHLGTWTCCSFWLKYLPPMFLQAQRPQCPGHRARARRRRSTES